MTIHSEHPFAGADRDQVRRLRARVGGTVSLWTAGELGTTAAGLTVSSYVVVTGEPGHIVAALDPDSDLAACIRETGRATVHLLDVRHRDLAEMFGGTMPAPGGAFAHADFVPTEYGPRLDGVPTWAAVTWQEERELGWSVLVTTRIDELAIGDQAWLVHREGRFQDG